MCRTKKCHRHHRKTETHGKENPSNSNARPEKRTQPKLRHVRQFECSDRGIDGNGVLSSRKSLLGHRPWLAVRSACCLLHEPIAMLSPTDFRKPIAAAWAMSNVFMTATRLALWLLVRHSWWALILTHIILINLQSHLAPEFFFCNEFSTELNVFICSTCA